jgi:2-isopropylmalate synthase
MFIKLIDLFLTCGTGRKSEAKLNLNIFGEKKIIKEKGNGPIDAIFNALKGIIPNDANLIVYQVNAITKGTDAQAEVNVRLEENLMTVQGQGSDVDTMVASAKAYINAMNKLIMKRKKAQDSKKTLLQTSDEELDKHVI